VKRRDVGSWQILLQNYFGHPRAKDFSKIRRKCATLIQKCIRCDTIVARFYSTDELRRLLQQYRQLAAQRVCDGLSGAGER
jgi:hypothetical protein